MTEKKELENQSRINQRGYWLKIGLSIRDGLRMHQVTGQMYKDPDSGKRPWGNVTEHCLVQVARVETLGRLMGLPEELIADMRMGAVLHDFSKKQEIEATREADREGRSPLAAVKEKQVISEALMREKGISNRIIYLANSTGGYTPALIETKRILEKEELTDEDLAYLICHYADDLSIGSDWIVPNRVSRVDITGKRVNIIDDRAEENKAKSTYFTIGKEIREELSVRCPEFTGMDHHDVMAVLSHQIERILSQTIVQRTGKAIDPLKIPELVDEGIRQKIEGEQ